MSVVELPGTVIKPAGRRLSENQELQVRPKQAAAQLPRYW
jgi:hypothetical protein